MLGGMRALPDDGWRASGDGDHEPPFPGEWDACGTVSHGFTHFGLDLQVRIYRGASPRPGDGDGDGGGGEGEWWPLARLEEAGLPTLYAKAAQLALSGAGNVEAGQRVKAGVNAGAGELA